MEAKSPANPDHGSVGVRFQPTRIVDGMIQDGYTGRYVVICPACGDDSRLDYASASSEARAIRGPYDSLEEGRAAAEHHAGYSTQHTRLFGLG